MATTASPRNTPSSVRRSPPTLPKAVSPPSSSIARGATARSAVSPRVAATATRRASLKGASPPVLPANGQTREVLSASLKEETELKEQLLVQVQDKDHTIVALNVENGKLTSALNAAETRLSELYADQGRAEEEMAARIEVAEKLRTQVRELEKEKRDILRRYNEQTATFEAERQTFYDNEQHLKSRIQSLSQARKQTPFIPKAPSVISIAESVETEVEDEASEDTSSDAKHDMDDPEELAEMSALKLELSTLSTSHASLQSTLMLLQTQLVDLKRVNHELQEENESYNILLREKTLSGQFDVMRMGGGSTPSEVSEDDDSDSKDAESFSSGHTGRSVLEPVDELAEEHDLDPEFESQPREPEPEEVSHGTRRHGRRRSSVSHSPTPRGESLANLPITGPGLDLAAELGRAENKDILDGHVSLDAVDPKRRKGKKTTVSDTSRKVSSSSEPGFLEPSTSINDLDQLRNEVKSLKDANKALSLYASKIIDRIISQEGFEHVLAVDYEKSPSTAGPAPTTFDQLRKSPKAPAPPPKKARPQSVFSFSSVANTLSSPTPERLTTFSSLDSPNTPSPPRPTVQTRARRSLSFDWKTFSVFGGERKSDQTNHPTLRPLTLKTVSPAITSARKLETYEDEEDRKERERLAATMKLMGIEKPATTTSPQSSPILKTYSAPSNSSSTTDEVASAMATPLSSRFSFFRRASSTTATSETSSLRSSMGQRTGMSTPNLTQEALEQAEAQNSIAALEARERQLSAEIAKGASGGFTEIVRRSTGDRRSRKSGGSGSTVWSAGMDKEMDE